MRVAVVKYLSLVERYLDRLFEGSTDEIRRKLLSLNGIGSEIADPILFIVRAVCKLGACIYCGLTAGIMPHFSILCILSGDVK
jgi:hypothetical protein